MAGGTSRTKTTRNASSTLIASDSPSKYSLMGQIQVAASRAPNDAGEDDVDPTGPARADHPGQRQRKDTEASCRPQRGHHT